MRTEQLQYLIEISKHKSMNIASQKLHISPQALSTAMKGLEKELNMQLLERTTMGVSLTDTGEKLKDIALQFFYDLAELQNEKPKTQTYSLYHLYLNVPFGFCETYLPSLLETLYTDMPNLEVSATPREYQEIIRLVEENEIPFGLTYKLFINGEDPLNDIPEHLNFTPLYEAKFYAMIPDTFPISNYKTISLKTFLEHQIIAYTPANYLLKPIYYYHAPEIMPKLINAPANTVISSLLSSGKGIALGMFDYSRNDFVSPYPENVRSVAFREKIQVIYGYITPKNAQLSKDTIAQLRYLDRIYHAE